MAIIPFVIQAGQSLSNAVNIGASKVVGVIVPANWTAAPLSALASTLGVTFLSLWRRGNEFAEPVVANAQNKLEPGDFSSVTFLQLQSGSVTSGLVNQAQTVTLLLITE